MKKLFAIMLAAMMIFTIVACTANETTVTTDVTEEVETPVEGETPVEDDAVVEETPVEPEAPASDLEYVKEKGNLVIGYTLYAPMNYEDDNGEFVGFDTEFALAVCEKLGVEAKFELIDWNTKEVSLEAKYIDCIWNGFTITAEREEALDFGAPYILNKQQIVIRKADADKYTSKEALKDAYLTAEQASAGESAIADDEFLCQANYTAVPYQTDALLAVKSRTADAAVLDYTLANAMVGEGTDYSDLMIVEGVDLAVEEYGVGFRSGSDIVPEFNAIYAELVADGTMEEIAAKYGLENNLIK